jgi:adenosylhomocysteine nucleosidase
MQPKVRLAIVAALKDELAAVRAAIPDAEARGVVLLRTGVGWNAAVGAAQALANSWQPPTLICSTGYCGALIPGVNVGDIVLSEVLLGPLPADRYHCSEERLAAVRAALTAAKIPFHHGAMLTMREPVSTPVFKRELGTERNALGVDMESYAIATRVGREETRTFALRAVSDAVDDELPPEVGGFFDQAGDLRFGRVTRFLMCNPAQIGKVLALKQRVDKAAEALTAAWKLVLPCLLA